MFFHSSSVHLPSIEGRSRVVGLHSCVEADRRAAPRKHARKIRYPWHHPRTAAESGAFRERRLVFSRRWHSYL